MHINKHYHFLFAIIFFISLITLGFRTQNVLAALNTADAISKAPPGIDISDYFSHGTSTNADFKTNSATTVSGNNQIMNLASGPSTVGAYWSTISKNNYIDVNEKQTVSAWLYFGDGSGSFKVNGEGMAFVLQADKNGNSAMGAGYEGLGVYGTDKATISHDTGDLTGFLKTYSYPKTYTPASIASTAIQNSLALEFDTELDNSTKPDESISSKPIGKSYLSNILLTTNQDYSLNTFDNYNSTLKIPDDYPDRDSARFGMGGGYGHIAVTYPSNSETYQTMPSGDSNFSKAFSMIHTHSSQAANLVDDVDPNNNAIYWHHLTVTWTPNSDGTATMSYSFNDINPNDMTTNYNTGDESNNFVRVNDSVKVDYKKIFGDTDHILWGFTGANGYDKSVSDKLVDFQSIPAMLYLDTDSTIVDHTLNERTITKDSSDTLKTIGDGDDLSLNYNLSFTSGRENWKTVSPVINLPKYFTAKADSNNNIGVITYKDSDGKTLKTENISANDLKSSTITIPTLDSPGTGLLGDKNSGLPTNATFTINGNSVNNDTKDVTSAPVASVFSGTNEISDVSSPEFIVRYKKTHKLQLTPESQTIDLPYKGDTGLTLPTTLKYDNGDDFLSSPAGEIIYKITINGKEYVAAGTPDGSASLTNPIDIKNDLIGNDTDFWNIFKADSSQKITITATDQDGITSNTATYTVNVIPNKSLEVTADSLKFQNVQAISDAKTLSRDGDLNLHVKSTNTTWYLYGTATDLKNTDDDTFNGFLFYNDKKNDLETNDIFIASHPDNTSYDDTISDDWAKDDGLLLYDNGPNEKGTFSGTVTWTAEDTPKNS